MEKENGMSTLFVRMGHGSSPIRHIISDLIHIFPGAHQIQIPETLGKIGVV